MKERLTGAVILVALIVLLVPELLSGPIRSAPQVAASAEDAPLRSIVIKVGDESHTQGAATAPASGPQQPAPVTAAAETPAPQPAPAPAPTPAVTKPAAETAPPPAVRPAAVPAAEPVNETAAPSGALVVQLGSFASRDNADRLAHQVKSQGFPVSVVRGTTGRHLYRVLVGPAPDHAAATQLEAKLRAAGHTGSIVPK